MLFHFHVITFAEGIIEDSQDIRAASINAAARGRSPTTNESDGRPSLKSIIWTAATSLS